LGVTAKIVHNKAGGFARSWGFGADVGVMYTIKDWKIGLKRLKILPLHSMPGPIVSQTEKNKYLHKQAM
jgi:hypothetical protein